MSKKILVPILGESITEATVSKWLINQGESIKVDEPIVELETDKVNLEVPSPINGILSKSMRGFPKSIREIYKGIHEIYKENL